MIDIRIKRGSRLYRFMQARVIGSLLALTTAASPSHAQVTTLLDLENSPTQAYTFYSYSFQAQLSQTFLTFEFRQDPAYWRLDDVSVTNGSSQLITNGGFEGGGYANGG
ncbi:MAG TPA: hypothetical protein VGF89_11100, partial [Steroidobacteraceae bacterium]